VAVRGHDRHEGRQLLRTTWRSMQSIVERVVADLAGRTDRLAGLERIGIDEISYRKGQRFLMIVVDHDSGRLAWAAAGAIRTPCGPSSTPSARSAPPG
jgi:transposase